MKQEFFKYVSGNILGMIGISIYILADTFFISLCKGADGITVLNLALPLYGLLFAIGSMIGVGSATRYSIKKAQKKGNTEEYFIHAILWQLLFSLPFIFLGIFHPEWWLRLMGGDLVIAELGKAYTRIVLIGSPFFMMNYTFTAFARNDNAPSVAMAAMLGASGFNIVFDYLFMFSLGMELSGAALATAMSPVVSSLICCSHFFSEKCTIKFQWTRLSVKRLVSSCKLGVSAFVGEISSAVTTTVFNMLLLRLAGNIAVAAYGVAANYSLVAMAFFNGISQGMQPLLSRACGQGKKNEEKKLLQMGLLVCLGLELLIVGIFWIFTDPLTAVFNSEKNTELAGLAHTALRLYFLGYLAAGINMVLTTWFSATGKALAASIASILRGAAAIVLCAVVMAAIWGLNGIWLSFFASEIITFIVILILIRRENSRR